MLVRRLLSAGTLAAFLAAGLPVAAPAQSSAAAAPTFAEPAISPDHAEIAFVSGGDVWSVPAAGGTARLLAAVDGYAARPLFSPDGKRLAFVSSRPGASGVYVLTLDGGALVRLTHDDVLPTLDAWAPDGSALYFTTSGHEISGDGDVYRVSVGGGTPMPVLHERYVNEMDAQPAPGGATIAFVRNGFSQWWRRGHSHIDEGEIVVAHLDGTSAEQITKGDAKVRWPMWSPDGRTLYFVSDRSGSDELWAREDGRLRALTHLHGDRVLWPTISRDGRTIAFERAFGIWTFDVASGETKRLQIAPRGLPDASGAPAHVTMTNRFSSLDLAPDGKKLAFVAGGRIFAAASAEGGEAQLVTPDGSAAYDLPVWAPGSRRLAYVVDRGTEQAIATYVFPDGPARVLTPAGHHDDYPHWSPDGKTLAFVRDGRELHLVDVAANADRIVARGTLDRRPFGDLGDVAFSPAGDWIAYADLGSDGFENVSVVRTSGGPAHQISFLPNANGGPLAWSPDGKRLYFVTSQRTEAAQVAQIDLVPRAPKFKEDTFRTLFQEQPARTELPTHALPSPAPSAKPETAASPSVAATAAPAKRTEIVFDGIRERMTLLPTGLDVARVYVTPDGKTLVLVANAAGQQNLSTFSVDDTSDDAVAHQITSTPGAKSGVSVAPDGKTVVYLDGGRVWNVAIDGSHPKALAYAAELDVDFARENALVFDQAWSLQQRWYADPNFHGANWDTVRRDYAPHALGARTPQELRRVISLMLGELNSSHSGIYAPPVPGVPRYTTGRLGVDWDAAEYARTGRLRIARVLPLGPAALSGAVHEGDELLAVDGTPVDRHTDLDALLAYHIGKRTALTIASRAAAGARREVAVLPISRPDALQLRYRAWVDDRRAYVDRISGGRIGYVHLYDMGEQSLQQFYEDLDVQNRDKRAVIVDIRNNNGGFVDPYAIDVLTRHEYLRFHSRFGADPPERSALGQRALDKPSVLVVNEHSLSDAENFTEAYRKLRAGKVVGVPTAGWIIFTSEATLADGSTLRLPSTRVMTEEGVDMELHPRPVDVYVEDPPGAAARGDDPQLDAAVRALEHR